MKLIKLIKTHKIVFWSIVAILIATIGIITFIILKDNDKDNEIIQENIIDESTIINFEDEFRVEDQNYYNQEDKFYYSANIYAIDDEQTLTCLIINFLDSEGNTLLSYQDNINFTVATDSYYTLSVNLENPIEGISTINYDICDIQ